MSDVNAERAAEAARDRALSEAAPNARQLAAAGSAITDFEALMAAADSAAARAMRAPEDTVSHPPVEREGDVSSVPDAAAPDLTTRYLGLELRSPIIASAGPLSQTVEGVKGLADAGLGAVVLYSLFEEQIRHEEARRLDLVERQAQSHSEASNSYFPEVIGDAPDEASTNYLRLIEGSVKACDVPIIASLNGARHGGWTDMARRMQAAGAAALELNIYMVPGEIDADGQAVEDRHVEIVQAVKQVVDIPVAVKLSPWFSSIGAMCHRLDEAGADGLVLFNRFFQPDVDIERLDVVPGVELSSPFEARLPRTWIALLRGKVQASLAGTSGVDTAEDVVKYLLSGADVVMTTSALVRHGRQHAQVLTRGLEEWLARKQLTLAQARGMLAVPDDASGYERAGYVAALQRAKLRYGG